MRIEESLAIAHALFGPDVSNALNNLLGCFQSVNAAAQTLVDEIEDRDAKRAMHADLTTAETAKYPNPLNSRILKEVRAIERACLPHLRLEK